MKTLLKRALLSIAAFVALAFTMNAQQYQDVVYLKNGSVIHGIITEQIPNQSLKIETKDGSVFICDMNDVAKITKDFQVNEEKNQGREYGWVSAPRYRGFVGESLVFGVEDTEDTRSQVFTSHGCQINPYYILEGDLLSITGLRTSHLISQFSHIYAAKYIRPIIKECLRILKQE